MKSVERLIVAAAGALCLHCAGSEKRDADQRDAQAQDGEANTAPAVIATMQVVRYTASPGNEPPLEGVDVCLLDPPEICGTSNADGVVALEVPAATVVAVAAHASGYWPTLITFRTGDSAMMVLEEIRMRDTPHQMATAGAVDVALDESKGTIGCMAVQGSGATARIEPGVELGPFYGVAGFPSRDASEVVGGAIWFFNVEPGEYEVELQGAERECRPASGNISVDAPSRAPLRVVSGHVSTSCAWDCTPTLETARYKRTETGPADAASCPARLQEAVGSDPSTPNTVCTCESCLDEIRACMETPGCVDIVQCAEEKACSLATCYQPENCQEVLDNVPSGISGDATGRSIALSQCVTSRCE